MELIKLYEEYLREERKFSERSVRDYLTALTLLSGKIDVLNTTEYKDVNDAIKEIKEKENWGQATVYKYALCIRNFFKWARREKYIDENPFPFTEWRKARPKAPKFLTEDQFEGLVNDPHLSHQELTLLYVFWDSGARLSEVASFRQEHIDLKQKTINIPFEISKGNYSFRYVPISETCTNLISRQFQFVRARGHLEAIFISLMDNQPMTANGLSKVLDKIGARQSPLRPQMRLSSRQFRHSFGIRMLEKGVPEVIVQKWLGHSSLSMTSRYINMTVQNSRNIYEKYVSA